MFDWVRDSDRVARVVSWLSGLIAVAFLLYKIFETGTSVPNVWWKQLIAVAAAFLLGFVAIALSRYALGFRLASDVQPNASSHVDVNAPTRSLLAPLIISIGTAGIVVLALTIIIVFASVTDDNIRENLDTLLLSIFSAVLPVFATWVGTILAFYYSNESFKQASDAARGAAGGEKSEELGKSARLIPYDKIARLDLKPDERAEAVLMKRIRDQFNPPASRIVIFSNTKKPLYIIRKKLDFSASEQTPAQTVEEYLTRDKNKADAQNFKFLPLKATVEDARAMLNVYRVADLFANDSGSADEPVKGWLTDDTLKS